MKRYRTIVVDPPWKQKAGPLRGGHGEGFVGTAESLDLPYETMDLAAIKAMPIADVAESAAHLYLWTTNKYLGHAFEVVEAWGFRYSTTLVWSKAPMGGGLGGCYGISSEYILFCRRGSLKAQKRIKGTVFHWKRPYVNGKPCSSKKPPEAYRMFAEVSPGPRLDMFARERHLGFDAWGNEVASDIELARCQACGAPTMLSGRWAGLCARHAEAAARFAARRAA